VDFFARQDLKREAEAYRQLLSALGARGG